jgi:spore germination cell wall hydrolase CwlJ-like protein
MVQVAAANEERQSSREQATWKQAAPDSRAISHGVSGSAGTLRAKAAEETSKAHRCLSLNVYWEARNQSLAGQIAVAQVTVNRARDPRYPTNICEVVYDHKQFSWYWDGKSDWPVESEAWEVSKLVASAALAGTGHADLQGVTHYHAVYVQPYWRDSMTQVTIIGDHIFYLDSSHAKNARAN